jgi:cobalt-zinc-cadmium efflux system outer membrane protein
MRTLYFWVMLILLVMPAKAEEASDVSFRQVEPQAALSLQDALKLALQANPEVSAAIREREATEGMRLQAGLRPNPTLSASLEATRSTAQKTTVQVSQPFEIGGKRDARIAGAEARLNAATAAIEVKHAETEAKVVAAFYEVLTAQEKLKLARSFLDMAAESRSTTTKRVQAGKISPVEETKSLLIESSVKIEANQAASALAIARKRLTAAWGNMNPQFTEVYGHMSVPILGTYESLANHIDQSPAMRVARLEIETRNAQVSIERTRATPDLTVSVGAQRDEELNANLAVLGVSMPIPLFDRNQGNLSEALSRADKARDELAALRIQMEAQLSSSFERFCMAGEAAQSLQSDILPGAQSAFEAAQKGFQYGKFSYLEVLDAQRMLFQAKSQYLNALVEALQASAEIHRVLGIAVSAPYQQQ